MLRDIFTSRNLITGAVFFLLIVGGTQLYSWHVRRTSTAELAWTQQALRALENRNLQRTAPVVKPRLPEKTVQSGAAAVEAPSLTTQRQTERDVAMSMMSEVPRAVSESPLSTQTEGDIADLEALIESILGEELQHFMLDLIAKYPIFSMSELELSVLTKTPGGQKEFWSQAQKFSDELLDYIAEQFSVLPPERLEEAIVYAEQRAMEQGEIPPHFLQQGFEKVRQKLNVQR